MYPFEKWCVFVCWGMRAECGAVCISLFFVYVQRLIMGWMKEDREIKLLLCPNVCHRFRLVMQYSAATHTSENQWWYKTESSLLFFKPKKSIYFQFIGLSLDLKCKWLTSLSHIQRHKRILQRTHLQQRGGQSSQKAHPADGGFNYKQHATLLKGNLRIVPFWKDWLQTGNQRPKSKSSPEANSHVFKYTYAAV